MPKKNLLVKPTFEQSYEQIAKEIDKRRPKWQLESVVYLSFDDVKMMILTHIHTKWEQYDPAFPLINWVSKIISNQMINISRNVYGSFKKPCLSCACAEGLDGCRLFGTQNVSCPILAKWYETKKTQHDIKLPVALEFHSNEASHLHPEEINIDATAESLHDRMKEILKPAEWRIYDLLYIQNKTEDEAAKFLHLKSGEKGKRKAGYRWIFLVKKTIMEKVKKTLYSENFDIIK